jgi:prevent-host-death family protein
MTRKSASAKVDENHWKLQDAKARLSEVVRRVREVGPQHVTVHGRDEVVLITGEEYRKLKGERRTGADLIAALQTFPWPEDLVLPERFPMPVRDIELP